MTHQVEIEFTPRKWSMTKLSTLKYYADLVSSSFLIGNAVKHDSYHYVDDTYYRWDDDSFKVKLYWGDEEDNEDRLCLVIISFEKDVKSISNRLKNVIEKEAIEITTK